MYLRVPYEFYNKQPLLSHTAFAYLSFSSKKALFSVRHEMKAYLQIEVVLWSRDVK